MKNFLNKIKVFALSHKKTSFFIGAVLIVVIVLIVRSKNNAKGDTQYVLSVVEKGTLSSYVSGTGQVSSSDEIAIKPKVSGEVMSISVKSGQKVSAGTLIAQINSRDIQKQVRDAATALESANINLAKTKIQNSDEDMNSDLAQSYDDGFTAVSNAFLDLPSIILGLENLLAKSDLSDNTARMHSKTALEYRQQAEKLYYKSLQAFNANRNNFRSIDRNSQGASIEKSINETYDTSRLVSDTIKSFRNFADYLAEDSTNATAYTAYQNTLSSYTTTINTDLSELASAKTNIKNYKDAIPATNLDVQSAQLQVKQKENALQDARDTLSDYYVRAPFDGTIAVVNIKKNDTANTSSSIATLITKKQIATISLNEVDIAKVTVGQKVTLTFDAVADLTIDGSVIEVDSIGTINQGVVTYNVKIGFDKEDERIKSGMSVSALIITEVKSDVLMVPNSAIKNKGDISYVEVFENDPSIGKDLQPVNSKVAPLRKNVEVGISNDTKIEVISGLVEGEKVVSRIINTTSAKPKAPTAPSLFGGGSTRGTTNSNRNAGR